MEPEAISLTTICNGAVPEVFERELREVLANITDPNTDAEKARRLKIEFVFAPYEDRSGAHVSFTVRATLQPVRVAKSRLFLSRQSGSLKAYATDARQGEMFGANDGKTISVVK